MPKEKIRNKEIVVAILNAKIPKEKKIVELDNDNPIAAFVKDKIDRAKRALKAFDVW